MKQLFFKSTVVLFLLSVFPLFAFAQSRFNIILDYHYQLGLSETGEYHLSRKDSKMYGNSLHLSAMYNFTNMFSAGLGIGADRYENPGYNTFPIFASVHYSPLRSISNVYAYTNLGYAVADKNDTYSGMVWDLGIGYKKMYHSHLGLNFQVGYDLKHIQSLERTRHSLSLGIGVIF